MLKKPPRHGLSGPTRFGKTPLKAATAPRKEPLIRPHTRRFQRARPTPPSPQLLLLLRCLKGRRQEGIPGPVGSSRQHVPDQRHHQQYVSNPGGIHAKATGECQGHVRVEHVKLFKEHASIQTNMPREIDHDQRRGQDKCKERPPSPSKGKVAPLAWRLHGHECQQTRKRRQIESKHQGVRQLAAAHAVQMLEGRAQRRGEHRGPASGADERGHGEQGHAAGAEDGRKELLGEEAARGRRRRQFRRALA
mmetsp:Transcript_95708/g.274850  ORF Transcript_95708/g.274850 Transcript_95708/m.274850 type:complete len:249 (+) Transcript_95708:143-889(+)